MNEQHHDKQDHPAYLCGRVLALLDRIHNEGARQIHRIIPGRPSIMDCSRCGLGISTTLQTGRIHLALVRKDPKRGWLAPLLDKDLSTLIAKFNDGATWPRMLSLEDQGRFAIGFDHERAPKSGAPADDNQTTENEESSKS